MKRFSLVQVLLAIIVVVMFVMFTMTAMAQAPAPGPVITPPAPAPVPVPKPVPQPWPPRNTSGYYYPEKMKLGDTPTPVPAPSSLALAINNLSGDFGLIYEKGIHAAMAPGVGLDIVNYKNGLVTLRAEAFYESPATLASQTASIIGGSLMVNLIQMAGQIPNSTWLATAINPSIGVFAGYDFANGKIAFGPMMSIINIAF